VVCADFGFDGGGRFRRAVTLKKICAPHACELFTAQDREEHNEDRCPRRYQSFHCQVSRHLKWRREYHVVFADS
jgi:hypothetical protein